MYFEAIRYGKTLRSNFLLLDNILRLQLRFQQTDNQSQVRSGIAKSVPLFNAVRQMKSTLHCRNSFIFFKLKIKMSALVFLLAPCWLINKSIEYDKQCDTDF
uniref:Uncharacterized protein n=1 Tax=Glossina brevipalpis TaxID=37001 RepID=A0A1A9WRL7_9MUSC